MVPGLQDLPDEGTIQKELLRCVGNWLDKPQEQFPKGGSLPVRCQGTRWISHKRKAMQRMVDRFEAYSSYVGVLIEDSAVKAADKARLKGYLQMWNHGKDPGWVCHVHRDSEGPFNPKSDLDQIDIVSGLKQILKSLSTLQTLAK